MNYLVLDTNIYINLCLKRTESVTAPCLKILEKLLEENRINIILPEIIRVEFQRNIRPEFERSRIFIKEVLNRIDKIILPHDTEKGRWSWRETDKEKKAVKEHLEKILSKWKDLDIQTQIKPVMEVMEHRNTTFIPTSERLLLKAYKRVIEKKAPAHNTGKRSEADCLIVESILYHFLELKEKGKGFFVTDNKSDFSASEDKNTLHPHLKNAFDELNIHYTLFLAKLLKDEFEQKIDEEDIKFEEEIVKSPVRHDIPWHTAVDLEYGGPFLRLAAGDRITDPIPSL